MWSMYGRHRRYEKLIPLLAAVLQLGTATWLPVIHPYIHPEHPLPGPQNDVTSQPGDHADGGQVEIFCFICAAGQQFSAISDQTFPLEDAAWWNLPPAGSGTYIHATGFESTNNARAPPSA